MEKGTSQMDGLYNICHTLTDIFSFNVFVFYVFIIHTYIYQIKNAMRHLKNTIASLESGSDKPVDKESENLIKSLIQSNGNKKDDIILQQQQQIEVLRFEISQLKTKCERPSFSNQALRDSLAAPRRSSIVRTRCSETLDIMAQKSVRDCFETLSTLKSDYVSLRKTLMEKQKLFANDMSAMITNVQEITQQHTIQFSNMANKYKEAMTLKRKYVKWNLVF